jgi:HAD superfamily hydrolase (TIGR01509 family)
MKAILFDLDGVLVDSEPASEEAWSSALARFGYDLGSAGHQGFMGKTDRQLAEHYAAIIGVEVSELEAMNQACLLDRLHEGGVYMFDDVPPLLGSLDGVPVAVASNSHRWRLQAILEGAGLADRFSVMVSSDDVDLPKPAPDVYLRAAQQLGVAPNESVVVEDTPTGIEAGRAAGMRVVAIDRGAYTLDLLGEADLVIGRLPVDPSGLW